MFICLCSVATQYKLLHCTLFCGSTLCTTSIILYFIATHCTTLLCCLLWQQYTQRTIFHGSALCTTSFCLSYGSILCTTSYDYSVANQYAPLHMTLFYGNPLCTTSYCYILWQDIMPVHPTKDLLCMSCIMCKCNKSGLVIVYSCTQDKLKYNLSCAM
jgi:hypothetical protein